MNFGWIEKRLNELPFVGFHVWMTLKIVASSLPRNHHVVRCPIEPCSNRCAWNPADLNDIRAIDILKLVENTVEPSFVSTRIDRV